MFVYLIINYLLKKDHTFYTPFTLVYSYLNRSTFYIMRFVVVVMQIARTGDTCSGDSGGGLVMATSTRWVQTGIVSWGLGCDKNIYYGVYTNVGMFYNWIEDIAKFSEEEVPDFLIQN